MGATRRPLGGFGGDIPQAYATLDVKVNRATLDVLEAATRRVAPHLVSQGVANALWSYATLGVRPMQQTLEALKDAAERSASAMKPQEVTNSTWAYVETAWNSTAGHVTEIRRP